MSAVAKPPPLGTTEEAPPSAPTPLSAAEITAARRRSLTARQSMCLEFIASYLAEHGYPPTLREIGAKMGIRSTNGVNDHLRALERKGMIEHAVGLSRGLRILRASGEIVTVAPGERRAIPSEVAAVVAENEALARQNRHLDSQNDELRALLRSVYTAARNPGQSAWRLDAIAADVSRALHKIGGKPTRGTVDGTKV